MKTRVTLSMWLMLCLLFVPHSNAAKKAKKISPIAYINSIEGKVKVLSAKKQTKESKPGTPLFAGDRVITGKKARTTLYIVGSGVLNLEGSSEIIVSKSITGKRQRRIFKLIRGAYRAVFERLASPIQLETPTAVAGIRGTRLVVDTKNIAVLEGSVEAYARRQKQKLVRLFSGDGFQTRQSRGQVRPIEFTKLRSLDGRFDFGIVNDQTPYVMTQQQWFALAARSLDYRLPEGWAAYPEQLYIDLFTGNVGADIFSDSYFDSQGRLFSTQDSNGNPVLVARKKPISVSYYVAVPETDDYEIVARMVGGKQYWTFDEKPTLLSPISQALSGSTIGPVRLERGIYKLTVSIPKEGKLSSFRLVGKKPVSTQAMVWSKDHVLKYDELILFLADLLNLEVNTRRQLSDADPGRRLFDIASLYEKLKSIVLPQPAYAQQGISKKRISRLRSLLEKKGYVLGESGAAVLGQHGTFNASLLKSGLLKNELELVKPKERRGKKEPNTYRTPLSPVIPSTME